VPSPFDLIPDQPAPGSGPGWTTKNLQVSPAKMQLIWLRLQLGCAWRPRFHASPRRIRPGPTVVLPDQVTYPVVLATMQSNTQRLCTARTSCRVTNAWNARDSDRLSRAVRLYSSRICVQHVNLVPIPRTLLDNRPTHGTLNPSGSGRCGARPAFGLGQQVQCYCTHLPEATQVHRAAVSRLLGLDIKSLVSPTAF
jgi:hypothetical protein